jgi:MFS family permease
MFWRFAQAIGSSPGLAVGTGVIGDIYKLEERGQAMGIFFAVCRFNFIREAELNAGFLRPFF